MKRSGESSAPGWRKIPPAFQALAASNPNAVLLETAMEDDGAERSFLFLDPLDELIAWAPEDLGTMLRRADDALSAGLFLAGFFHYECGVAFVGTQKYERPLADPREPVAWLGVFRAPIVFDHSTGGIRGVLPPVPEQQPTPIDASPIHAEEIDMDLDDYRTGFQRIQEYLRAGDTYQVNFTGRIHGTSAASPLAVYRNLLEQQPVSYAAFLNRPLGAVLSFSPELFYRTSDRRVTVRPMKGTWARGRNLTEDREAAGKLARDEKNRSEHVMIVDLERSDLGRICEFGSVHVEKLFHVEHLRTLLQMTSTISGTLRPDVSPSAVFANLFPSGSITGAPKRRTMEIIRELERQPRGIYTGAIGYFGPGGEACFNVAIRTLRFSGHDFCFGVGGGITVGSDADNEYEECRLKAAFLSNWAPPFALIETMLAERGILLLHRHMKRLAESAEYFGIQFDAARLQREIADSSRSCGTVRSRVRVTLNRDGSWKIVHAPLDEPRWRGRLLLADERVLSTDVFRHHKTTNRVMLDRDFRTARTAGFDELVYLNERAEITEGAISNLFFEIDGVWTTPELGCGVLPGVMRSQLLGVLHPVIEGSICLEDLRRVRTIFACSSLRGIRQVRRIETRTGEPVWVRQGHEAEGEAGEGMKKIWE